MSNILIITVALAIIVSVMVALYFVVKFVLQTILKIAKTPIIKLLILVVATTALGLFIAYSAFTSFAVIPDEQDNIGGFYPYLIVIIPSAIALINLWISWIKNKNSK